MRKKRCSVALMGNIRSVFVHAHMSTFKSASTFFFHVKTCFDLFFLFFSFAGVQEENRGSQERVPESSGRVPSQPGFQGNT